MERKLDNRSKSELRLFIKNFYTCITVYEKLTTTTSQINRQTDRSGLYIRRFLLLNKRYLTFSFCFAIHPITKAKQLRPFTDIVAVYCENHTTHINTLIGGEMRSLNVKSGDACIKCCALKRCDLSVKNVCSVFTAFNDESNKFHL